jgi:hypothetical protein
LLSIFLTPHQHLTCVHPHARSVCCSAAFAEEGALLCDASCALALEKKEMVTTASGLQYKEITPGTGPKAITGYQVTATTATSIHLRPPACHHGRSQALHYSPDSVGQALHICTHHKQGSSCSLLAQQQHTMIVASAAAATTGATCCRHTGSCVLAASGCCQLRGHDP